MYTCDNWLFIIQSLLVQLAPKECILIHNDQHPDAAKLRSVIGRSNILVTDRKRSTYVLACTCVLSVLLVVLQNQII